jgi:hypothetical protein
MILCPARSIPQIHLDTNTVQGMPAIGAARKKAEAPRSRAFTHPSLEKVRLFEGFEDGSGVEPHVI